MCSIKTLENVAGPRANRYRTWVGVTMRFLIVGHAGVVLAFVPYLIFGSPRLYFEIVLWTIAAGLCLTLGISFGIRFLPAGSYHLADRLGPANQLTLLRLVLIAPLIVMMGRERWTTSLVLYLVLVSTDMLDGALARRRDECTEFGTIMDPLADVFSNGLVYAVFWVKGFVPTWVFVILLIRYGMLLGGSLALSAIAGPIRFKATPAGKVAAVMQALVAAVILILEMRGTPWKDGIGLFIYPFLGVVFGAVIFSQLVIGLNHIWGRSIE